jgi:hypothetical protein
MKLLDFASAILIACRVAQSSPLLSDRCETNAISLQLSAEGGTVKGIIKNVGEATLRLLKQGTILDMDQERKVEVSSPSKLSPSVARSISPSRKLFQNYYLHCSAN